MNSNKRGKLSSKAHSDVASPWHLLPYDCLIGIIEFLAPVPSKGEATQPEGDAPQLYAQRELLSCLLTARCVCRGWSGSVDRFDSWIWRRLFLQRFNLQPQTQRSLKWRDLRAPLVGSTGKQTVLCVCSSPHHHDWRAMYKSRLLAQAQISELQKKRVLLRMQLLSKRGKGIPSLKVEASVCSLCGCCAVLCDTSALKEHLRVHHTLRIAR